MVALAVPGRLGGARRRARRLPAGPRRRAGGRGPRPGRGRPPLYYLSLGDSLSRGVQPDPAGQNQPTDQGYADDLAKVGRLVLP
jgi:hypothetical protein